MGYSLYSANQFANWLVDIFLYGKELSMAYFTKIQGNEAYLFKRNNGIYYYYFYKDGTKIFKKF